jgi:hypothetical protein
MEMQKRFSCITRSVLAPGIYNANVFEVAVRKPPCSRIFKLFLIQGVSKGCEGIKEYLSSVEMAEIFNAMGLRWRVASLTDPAGL